MLPAIAIGFRETLEMLLVIFSLSAYVIKINKKPLLKYIFSGSITGSIFSLIIGLTLFNQISSLQGLAKEIFEGSMMLFVSALIAYNIIWMGNSIKNYSKNIEEKFRFKSTAVSLFLLSFFTIFRESLEIIIFVIPIIWGNLVNIAAGVGIGFLISILVMYILYKTTIRLNINILFDGLTLILVYIGALMFGEGLAAFLPSVEGILLTGKLIYGLPILFIYIKQEIKRYTKK